MGLFNLFKSSASYNDEVARQTQSMGRPTGNPPLSELPASNPAISGELLMTVEDVFSISGRGTVATGMTNAQVSLGQTVRIINSDGSVSNSTVIGVEAFKSELQVVEAGQAAGLLLQGVTKDQIKRSAEIRAV